MRSVFRELMLTSTNNSTSRCKGVCWCKRTSNLRVNTSKIQIGEDTLNIGWLRLLCVRKAESRAAGSNISQHFVLFFYPFSGRNQNIYIFVVSAFIPNFQSDGQLWSFEWETRSFRRQNGMDHKCIIINGWERRRSYLMANMFPIFPFFFNVLCDEIILGKTQKPTTNSFNQLVAYINSTFLGVL